MFAAVQCVSSMQSVLLPCQWPRWLSTSTFTKYSHVCFGLKVKVEYYTQTLTSSYKHGSCVPRHSCLHISCGPCLGMHWTVPKTTSSHRLKHGWQTTPEQAMLGLSNELDFGSNMHRLFTPGARAQIWACAWVVSQTLRVVVFVGVGCRHIRSIKSQQPVRSCHLTPSLWRHWFSNVTTSTAVWEAKEQQPRLHICNIYTEGIINMHSGHNNFNPEVLEYTHHKLLHVFCVCVFVGFAF